MTRMLRQVWAFELLSSPRPLVLAAVEEQPGEIRSACRPHGRKTMALRRFHSPAQECPAQSLIPRSSCGGHVPAPCPGALPQPFLAGVPGRWLAGDDPSSVSFGPWLRWARPTFTASLRGRSPISPAHGGIQASDAGLRGHRHPLRAPSLLVSAELAPAEDGPAADAAEGDPVEGPSQWAACCCRSADLEPLISIREGRPGGGVPTCQAFAVVGCSWMGPLRRRSP